MIHRPRFKTHLKAARGRSFVVALLGPRQSGKTTLARLLAREEKSEYFDLEDPRDVSRLSAPMLALEESTGLVVIDEIQRMPGLFEILRVLVDHPRVMAKFLVLGSASPHLVKCATDTSYILAKRPIPSTTASRRFLSGIFLPCLSSERRRSSG
jgi:predicted AAA+ superfamily ATPase